jgi:hypothetical protein
MSRATSLALMTALTATSVSAQTTDPKIHWCDGCSVEQEKNMVPSFTGEMGNFYFYIGNLPAQTVHKYQLARAYSEPPCSGRPGDPNCQQLQSMIGASVNSAGGTVTPQATILTYVYDSVVEPDIDEAFRNAINYYYTEPVGWQKQYEVQFVDASKPSSLLYKEYYRDGQFEPKYQPGTNTGVQQVTPVIDFPDHDATVYDVVVYGAKQKQFLDYFLTPGVQQFQTATGYLLKIISFASLFDADKLPATVIAVKFNDGSGITIKLDISTTSPQYVIDESSAYDSHGNRVPVRQQQIQGIRSEYNFQGAGNTGDRPKMWNQLLGLGADLNQVPVQSLFYQCGPSQFGGAGVTCYIQ